MVKSVKAIILASVMVSMSVMLINSCGVSNPTSSTGVSGLSAATGCVPSVPGAPDPGIYLPTGISSDAAKALLENPYANPNASGTPVPYPCGTYVVSYHYGSPIINSLDPNNPKIATSVTHPILRDINGPGGIFLQSGAGSVTFILDLQTGNVSPDPLQVYYPKGSFTFIIPCNLLPNGANLPPDMFAGNGYPDGDYVIGGDWFSLAGGKATWKGRVTPCTPDGARPKKPPVVASLTITPQDISIGANKTTQFSVTGTMSDGTPANPAIINKSTVNWVSSDASIAVIYNGGTSGGQAWGKSRGTVDIWAEHNGIKSNVAKLHVGNQLQSISVSPASATIYIHPTKGTQQYTASGSYSDGSSKPLAKPITWDTLPGGTVTIDANGLVTAAAPGTTYITAASTADGTTITSGAYDAELCVECWRYTHYRQNAGSWANTPFAMNWDVIPARPRNMQDLIASGSLPVANYGGYYRYSIAGKGCNMTSWAMALSAAMGTPITPGALNYVLQTNGGYTDQNAPDWQVIKNLYPSANIVSMIDNQSLNTILQNCDMAIISTGPSGPLQSNGKKLHPKDHYILAVKLENGKYKIYDPWVMLNSNGNPTENLVQLDDLLDSARQLQLKSYIGIKIQKN